VKKKLKDIPRVALCGRRNAGKSTMLNALYGKNRAITDETPGLTRDVLEVEIRHKGHRFLLSDLPGLDIDDPSDLEGLALQKAKKHLEEMDLIILLLESPHMHPYDHLLVDLLRKIRVPVCYAVNKIDGPEKADMLLTEFYEAGLTSAVPVSAASGWNIKTLLGRMAELVPEIVNPSAVKTPDISTVISDSQSEDLRIAIAGRPNAGKSSLFNRLIQKELSLVSEVPGTTRDTIDSLFNYKGRTIRVIDTAGLRRNSYLHEEKNKIERFSIARTKRGIQDSKVVIHLVDALEGITDFDKKISSLILELRKPCVIGVNKWDAVENKDNKSVEEYLDRIYFLFPYARNYPVIFLSALTGQRLDKLIDACIDINERMSVRVPTAKLNKLLEQWNGTLKTGEASSRIMYAVQVESAPPEFVFFIKSKKNFRGNFQAFFENKLRKEYALEGIPITIHIREREEKS